MEQNHDSNEPLRDPALVGDVLRELFDMDSATVSKAIDQRQTQVRGKLIEHYAQSLRDELNARSQGDDEDGDDSIEAHRTELWKLNADDKGAHRNE